MSQTPLHIRQELESDFTLPETAIDFFRENGFIKLKNVLSPGLIQYMNETISSEVVRLNTQHLPMEERDTYGKAFLQIMNIWIKSPAVKEIVFSKRLAKIAADLMDVNGVRMYHDQALWPDNAGGAASVEDAQRRREGDVHRSCTRGRGARHREDQEARGRTGRRVQEKGPGREHGEPPELRRRGAEEQAARVAGLRQEDYDRIPAIK